MVLFAIHSHESVISIHVFPILTPLPPPSPSYPSGLSQYTSPEHPVLWRSISYMIIYMFQCYSLKSSQLRLLPQSPKSVLYIYVSFAALHIESSLPSFKIPYICVNVFYWCFSFWLTLHCMISSSFIHLIRAASNAFFLIVE